MIKRLLAATVMFLAIGSLAQAQWQDFYGFTDDEKSCALEHLNTSNVDPDNVKFKNSEDLTTYYAGIEPDPDVPGGFIVEMYWMTFKADFRRFEEANPGQPLTSNEKCGVYSVFATHELYHKCMGLNPLPPGPNSCASEATSCQHLAIDFATATEACNLAIEMLEERNNPGNSPEEQDLAGEILFGVCLGRSQIEEKWNSPENKVEATAVANECICPTSMGQGGACPFQSNASCAPVQLPPAANGPQSNPSGGTGETGYDCGSGPPFDTGDDIIPACAACEEA